MAEQFAFVLTYERLSKLRVAILYALESPEFEETLNKNERKAWDLLLTAIDRCNTGLLTSGRVGLTEKENRGIDGILTLAEADIHNMEDGEHPWTHDELTAGLRAVANFQRSGWVPKE